MGQFRCSARLLVISLGVLLAGCGDGQQSDWATKMKRLLGGQSASPSTAAAPDPQQVRLAKLKELHKKAEAGDVLAMVELGHVYEEGFSWRSGGKFGGIPIEESGKKSEGRDLFAEAGIDTLVDLHKAADWYEKAAIQGNAEAQYRLGALLLPSEIDKFLGASRKGRPADAAKAAVWFEKAAAQGNALAQFSLSNAYRIGEGVPKDLAKAADLLERAALQGYAKAQSQLGLIYTAGGGGVPKNETKGAEWFHKAAEQGDVGAQLWLGMMYAAGGGGVPKDAVKAFDWYHKAAKQGDATAQHEVGRFYFRGDGVPKDDAKAVEWVQKAAIAGHTTAQRALGASYIHGLVAADDVLGYAWSNLAAGRGDDTAGQNRDEVVRRMTPAEIAEAQRLSSSWKVGQVLARESTPSGRSKPPSSPGSLAKKGTGTAFVVGKSGHAITNKHVTDGCIELRIEGHDGVAKHVTEDAVNDLALVQIPGEVKAAASIVSDPAKLRQGEDIVVFGFRLNSLLSSGGNLTPGVVSAMTGLGNNTSQIQITAPIQPGSSGSPVLNKKGEVVGVVSMKLSDSKMAKATGSIGQNVNFAVSGQTLRTFLDTHKVEYRSGGLLSFEKSTADLADEARRWTLVLECWK